MCLPVRSHPAGGTRVLKLRAEPLAGNPEGQDFELMGLSGDMEFLVDGTTGLPLRIRGEAPRIGGGQEGSGA